jgi:hypothetical protein
VSKCTVGIVAVIERPGSLIPSSFGRSSEPNRQVFELGSQ